MKKEIPEVPCHIKGLNLHCFGCCGNSFTNEEHLLKDIFENTCDLEEFGFKLGKKELVLFRDRYDFDCLSESGLCFNLVDLGEGCLGCPIHFKVNKILPENSEFEINNKEDLRVDDNGKMFCDINEECIVFKRWKEMNDAEKLEFMDWLNNMKYNSFSYSMDNADENLWNKYTKR